MKENLVNQQNMSIKNVSSPVIVLQHKCIRGNSPKSKGNAFLEKIVKPVRKNGPPLKRHSVYCLVNEVLRREKKLAIQYIFIFSSDVQDKQ